MTSYAGRHAELYDLFYADKPYAEEAAFVDSCLKTYQAGYMDQILELACGTGTHAVELAQRGYEVTATDISESMLECARRKAKAAGYPIRFERQDMRDLDLPGRLFDAAICLFDSIGYAETNEGLWQTLRGLRRLVRPQGLFIFEFWHAAAILRTYDPVCVQRWTVPEGQIVRIAETTLDAARQTAQVNYTIYELRNNGTFAHLEETQTNRYFLLQEMASWLNDTGFLPVKWFAGFTPHEAITAETWHIVAVARRG